MNKERHKVVSDEFFLTILKEAEKLSQIIQDDGFSVRDFVVIATLMQSVATYTIQTVKDDS